VAEETAMIAMNEKKALALLAAVIALGVLGTVSAQAQYNYNRKGGFVVPCSLAGVNPAVHLEIFSDPFIAREEYGFIRLRDGTWQVEGNCVRGPYHN
jgi:hypothetical protein